MDTCVCVLQPMLQLYRIMRALGQLRGLTSACTREDRVTAAVFAPLLAYRRRSNSVARHHSRSYHSTAWRVHGLQGGGAGLALLVERRHQWSGGATSAASSEPRVRTAAKPLLVRHVPFFFMLDLHLSHVLYFCNDDFSMNPCTQAKLLLCFL